MMAENISVLNRIGKQRVYGCLTTSINRIPYMDASLSPRVVMPSLYAQTGMFSKIVTIT